MTAPRFRPALALLPIIALLALPNPERDAAMLRGRDSDPPRPPNLDPWLRPDPRAFQMPHAYALNLPPSADMARIIAEMNFSGPGALTRTIRIAVIRREIAEHQYRIAVLLAQLEAMGVSA